MVSYGMVIQPKKKLFLSHTSSILLGVLMGAGSLFNNIWRASYIHEYPSGKEEGYYTHTLRVGGILHLLMIGARSLSL
jgi:uncharacterized membrane protein YphA (DoxX/SURF4 family)